MKARGLLLAIALLGCGEPAPARGLSLLAMDSDRLWILLQAAKVNPRCRELYAGSTDPRISGLAEKCAEAERRVIAWLEANGVEDAEVEDLREPEFWHWYRGKVEAIQRCQSVFEPGSKGYWTDFHGCDPFDRIVRVEKKTVADAGYREPKD
jgi:hypothetical protein